MTTTDQPVRWLEHQPLDDLTPALRNPRQHDTAAITRSISEFGYLEPIVLDERTGRLVAGHGRVDVLAEMRGRGEVPPDGVTLDEAGRWLVPVQRGWSSRSDAQAHAAGIALNRVGEKGGWDDRALAELLEELDEVSPALLAATGYTADDLDHLLASFSAPEAERELAAAKDAQPSPRVHELDAILTLSQVGQVACFLAVDAGLRVGSSSAGGRSLIDSRARWEWKFPLTFIDNEWHDYDHSQHVDVVAAFRPKYATVRDVMTRQQCDDAGVAYYDLDTVLGMAEEVAAHAQNVIVVPKYDCLDQIPPQYVLGYSVRSSYGATPIPAWKFRDRPVHLLGGSWADQRRYLSIIGDSIVSLDFNHPYSLARYGSVVMPDGSLRVLERDWGLRPANHMAAATALSLGNISKAIFDLTGGRSGAAAEPEEPPADFSEVPS